MRRLAVLSDIHGNMRALEAVLADIDSQGIKSILNLGDCAYGPFDPTQVMERLMARNITTVSGNEDRILVDLHADQEVSRTAQFTLDFLSHQHLDWLSALPPCIERHDWMAFHGSPTSRTDYLLTRPTADVSVRPATHAEITVQLSGIEKPLILCGHDHLPRHVVLEDGRVIVNPGSVGCPAFEDDMPIQHCVENGTPHARYVVVTLADDRVHAESIDLTYDWEAASREATANGFPDWAHWIATGCS